MREALDPIASAAARAAMGAPPDIPDSVFVEGVRSLLREQKGLTYNFDDTAALLNSTYGEQGAPPRPSAAMGYPGTVGTATSSPLDDRLASWFAQDAAGQSKAATQTLRQLKADFGADAVAGAIASYMGGQIDQAKAGTLSYVDYYNRAGAVESIGRYDGDLYPRLKAMGWNYDSPDFNPRALYGIPKWDVMGDLGPAMIGLANPDKQTPDVPKPVMDAAKFAGSLGRTTLRNTVDRVWLAGNAALANGGLAALLDPGTEVGKDLGRAAAAFAGAVVASPDDMAEKYASLEQVVQMASDENERVRSLMAWQWGQDLPGPVRDAIQAATSSFGLDHASSFHPGKAAVKLGATIYDPLYVTGKALSLVRAARDGAATAAATRKIMREGLASAAMADAFNMGKVAFPHPGEWMAEAADVPEVQALLRPVQEGGREIPHVARESMGTNPDIVKLETAQAAQRLADHSDILQGLVGQVPELRNLPAYYDAQGLAKAMVNNVGSGRKALGRLQAEAETAARMEPNLERVDLMSKRRELQKLYPKPEGWKEKAAHLGATWQGQGPPTASLLDDMMTKTNATLTSLGYDEPQIDEFWRTTDQLMHMRQAAGRATGLGVVGTLKKDL